ncbi:hypothetical protein K432DRAFT_430688 [Lepidopterella palustris CBS 459.81]|uniref:F-box domain-containing protein n=1 Tax=Lepidopterella palustris CBS 459.81 TaxID=1314670 RepID=A0A8E2J8E9_9PEZI|nr:hypothetical protein K432DRAFT_430688 [Lepidopterella palustris CBS 459.81]
MDHLTRTPDILFQIILHCDIDTLLCLRLTCHTIHDLISSYESTIIQSVAYITFPRSKRLFLYGPPDGLYNLKWLLGLIPKQLAAIAVDQHRWQEKLYITDGAAAEDPIGDELRERVANGFRILQRFSTIAKEVDTVPASEMPQVTPENHFLKSSHIIRPVARRRRIGLVGSTGAWLSQRWIRAQETTETALKSTNTTCTWRKELWILEKREKYLKGLPPESACHFMDMFYFIEAAFVHLDQQSKYFDWDAEKSYRMEYPHGWLCNSWVAWFILREGPKLFWQQWWANKDLPDEPPILDRIKGAWAGRSSLMVKMERESCMRLMDTIDLIIRQTQSIHDYNRPRPRRYFEEYKTAFSRRCQAAETHPEEILDYVAFHVDEKPFVSRKE